MSAVRHLLDELHALGGHLEIVARNRLVVEAPGELPAELLGALRRNKASLIAMLTPARGDAAPRGAIMEHDAGIPQEWVDGVAHLDQTVPPADVPAMRWRRFIADCARFLEGRWAARAAALGWG